MVDTVTVPYTRTFSQPLDDAFAWLTDYDNQDADRAGAIIEDRRVLEEEDNVVILQGQLETLGRRMDGTAVVHLDPPDHWRANLYDTKQRVAGVYDYRLEPHHDGCKLTVAYQLAAPKLRHKLLLWLGKPLIRRQLDTMWDGFEAAMNQDLNGAPPSG